jgi:hypothetical protein
MASNEAAASAAIKPQQTPRAAPQRRRKTIVVQWVGIENGTPVTVEVDPIRGTSVLAT